MVNVEPTFRHHLFEITIAQWISQIPAHAQNDNVVLKMTVSGGSYASAYPTKAAANRFVTLPKFRLRFPCAFEAEDGWPQRAAPKAAVYAIHDLHLCVSSIPEACRIAVILPG